MKVAHLHPELQKVYGRIPSVPFHNRYFLSVVQLLQKTQRRKILRCPGVAIEDRALDHCRVRVYQCEAGSEKAGPEKAALLWIHGGGYILGGVNINDRECAAIAQTLGVVVVSVDYRLAPAHPFPAPLADCFEAWRYIVDNSAELGIERERIAILGQSAGGGLAAGLAQMILDAGGVQPAAQVLMYPMLDDRTAANRALDGVRHRLWNNRNNRAGWSCYLGQPAGLDTVPPYAVPARREDLSGLPPAWIGVGDLDLFYEEDLRYADRLQAAGVHCETFVEPRCPHAYDLLAADTPVAQALIRQYHQFLKTHLALS